MKHEHLHSASFNDILYQKEFENYFDAIDFLNPYNDTFLRDKNFLISRLERLTQYFDSNEISSCYKAFPSASSVIRAIDMINQPIRNPADMIDPTIFTIDLSNGSGAFHCFEEISFNA